MIKTHAIKLLGMCFPQDKPSKLNHCLTEIQTFKMMEGALLDIGDEEMLNDLLHKRVLQLVQNRKRPRCASEWKAAYAANMQSRITGECAYKYCYDCATNSMEAIGYPDWMCTTPADAVQDEMECWDD
jgi:hypothetical protein